MSWAAHAIAELGAGRNVEIRPRGHSMKGKVEDGQAVLLAPCRPEDLRKGDIVLVRVHGRDFLHLIKAVGAGGSLLIGNNRGGVNGWVGGRAVYGKAVRIGP